MKKFYFFIITALLAALTCFVPDANAYVVPGTGVVKCYSSTQEISCPAYGQSFYGQDGNFQTNQISYMDNGDGTVTDLITGLVWQKSSDSLQRSLSTANQYCTDLNLGGMTGWRVPSMKELTTLVDASKNSPALNTSVFECPSCYTFWSSTVSYVSTTNWVVNFEDGMTTFDYGNADYVRCVHGSQLQ